MAVVPNLVVNSFTLRSLYELSEVGKGVKEGAGLFRRAVTGTASLAWRATKWSAWKAVTVLPQFYVSRFVGCYTHELGHLFAGKALLGKDADPRLDCYTLGMPSCAPYNSYSSLTDLGKKIGRANAQALITEAGPALEAAMMIFVANRSRRAARILLWNTAWWMLMYPLHNISAHMGYIFTMDGDYEKLLQHSPLACAALTAYICLAVLYVGIRANGRDKPVISKKCLSQLKEVVTHLEKEYSVDQSKTGERSAIQEKILLQFQETVVHLAREHQVEHSDSPPGG